MSTDSRAELQTPNDIPTEVGDYSALEEKLIKTKEFIGKNNKVEKVVCEDANGQPIVFEADLVIIAAGFIKPETTGLLSELDIQFNAKQTVATNESYQTNDPKVFCCGDMRRGQSLIVWALYEGQQCAVSIDRYLK